MNPVPDPIRAGIARGWQVLDGAILGADNPRERTIEADVAIIGTGAGGGITAEILARAGLRAVLIEEGPLKSSDDFRMREAEAYTELYWDNAARKSKDKAIQILQGRTVGGSTTVNWTSSFRTPEATLDHWTNAYGLRGVSRDDLAPWFDQVERRLRIAPWDMPANENNDLLRRGAHALGIPTGRIQRNVRNCWNLGYCGMGCPTNAKLSMLVSTLPVALDHGAQLLVRMRAHAFAFAGDRIDRLDCHALDASGLRPGGACVAVRARHYVLAAGAINTPGVLLRSGAPDPHALLGTRTFLHPVVICAALMDHDVDAFRGAPQSVYSDHFLDTLPPDGPIGFKLEAPPLHPVLYATTLHGFGAAHARLMREFPRAHALLALMRDGFHPDSPGGRVELRGDGSPVLDYPITEYVWEGARRALLAMAQIQFAAGARTVHPIHELAGGYASWPEAKRAIEALPMRPHLTRVVSAHVMGGCRMGSDAGSGVVDSRGRHFQLANLSIHDGSLFPTSIGANPQLSVYGLAAKLASQLVAELSGAPAPALA